MLVAKFLERLSFTSPVFGEVAARPSLDFYPTPRGAPSQSFPAAVTNAPDQLVGSRSLLLIVLEAGKSQDEGASRGHAC